MAPRQCDRSDINSEILIFLYFFLEVSLRSLFQAEWLTFFLLPRPKCLETNHIIN